VAVSRSDAVVPVVRVLASVEILFIQVVNLLREERVLVALLLVVHVLLWGVVSGGKGGRMGLMMLVFL
jgi:hypothetical protein